MENRCREASNFEFLSHTERSSAENLQYQSVSDNVSLTDIASALPIPANLGAIRYRELEFSTSAKYQWS